MRGLRRPAGPRLDPHNPTWVCGFLLVLVCLHGVAGAVPEGASEPLRHRLVPERWWFLNMPAGVRQFDASALLLRADGRLWTVNDRSPSVFAIEFPAAEGVHEAALRLVPGIFTPDQLAHLAAAKAGRYDAEGLAEDEQGRIYLCEEANRWILRYDARLGRVDRLPVDWAPVEKYFSRADPNASFEGVAVGGGRLYVANERGHGRIVVVDLETLRVTGDFAPRPAAASMLETSYSDLCFYEGALYVLLRESRCVLEVDPADNRVRAEYDYRAVEEGELRYRSLLPVGNMEGLAVDREYFWLLTDNNGQGRVRQTEDIRPALIRCRRPSAGGGAPGKTGAAGATGGAR